MTGGLVALVALLAAPPPAGSQLFDEERVTAAAVVGAAPLVQGDLVRAAVAIRVGRGFHVNANPASEDFLIPTGVSVDAGGVLEVVDVFYPAPLERDFGFWPETLKVWEGEVVAGVMLRVVEGAEIGDRDIEFVVDYQACNDEACFAPAKTSARIAVQVAAAGTPARTVDSPLLDRAVFERRR
jgi:hypothetical protein